MEVRKQALVLISFLFSGCAVQINARDASSSLSGSGDGFSAYYVYVTNRGTSDVSIFQMDTSTGDLTETDGSKLENYTDPQPIVFHPNGKYGYIGTNIGGANDPISVVQVGKGTLTEIQSVPSSGSLPWFISIDPGGQHMYTANIFSDDISHFTVDADSGFITFQALTPQIDAQSLVVDHSGSYLYVGKNIGTSDISIYDIAGDGSLTLNVTSPLATGTNARDIFMHPTLDVFYSSFWNGANGLRVFTINLGDGSIAETELHDPMDCPDRSAITADGTFVAVARDCAGPTEIQLYSVSGTDGTLTDRGAYPVTTVNAVEGVTWGPNGKFLYMVDATNEQVMRFERSGNTLINLTAVGNTGTTPFDIKIQGYSP